MSQKIEAGKYISMYGPTVGDKVRLGDTDLFIEVEKDYTVYGDECKFGGGKSLRNGMGQSATGTSKNGDLDLVITNALILDYWGIVKADIGIKDGKIVGIGKAGNPDIMDGVDHNMVVGASTEALSAEGAILVHFKTVRVVLLVLHRVVVSLLALIASQSDLHSHLTAPPY